MLFLKTCLYFLPPLGGLHDELLAEDVAQLGPVPVPAPGDLLLIVIVIRRGEEVTEDQLRHIDPLLLVDLHRDTPPVIEDGDPGALGIDIHLDGVHAGITDLVIGGIHQDLIEDLVESGHEGHGALDHGLILINPESLRLGFNGSDVGIRAQQDVFQLGLLLVDLLQRTIIFLLLGLFGFPFCLSIIIVIIIELITITIIVIIALLARFGLFTIRLGGLCGGLFRLGGGGGFITG